MKKIAGWIALLLVLVCLFPCDTQAEIVASGIDIEEQCGLEEFQVNYVDEVEDADIVQTPQLRSAVSGYWTNFSSDYFYNQLSASQKNLYDALDSLCYNYMTSTENMLDTAQTKYVPYSGMSYEEAVNIAYIFALTEGQYYFLNDSVHLSYTGSSGKLSLGVYPAFVDGTARYSQTVQLQNRLDAWLAEIKTESGQIAREKKAHDIVVNAATYAENEYDQSCISIIKSGTSVCAGYTKLFGMLCNAAGVNTINLTSSTHAWNAVQISGEWFNVDCTWDDPVGGTRVYYTYFNKSDAAIRSGNNSHFVTNKWYTYTQVPTCSSDNPVESPVQNVVPIYRLYNPNTGEHLYTDSAYEKDVLYTYWGWGYEGIAWYASANNGTPVYRLYQPELGNHLYTTNLGEIAILTTSYGWTMDFDGQPLFYSDGSIPIYRLFNIGLNGLHHWTTNQGEYNVLPQYGWAQEGAQFYAVREGVLTGRTDYYLSAVGN